MHIVNGTCHHDCPDSCGWQVTVEDGVAVKIRGNPDHPFSQGELCPKVNRLLDRVYSPDRVLTPLRRTGHKGESHFEPISASMSFTSTLTPPIASRPTRCAGCQRIGGNCSCASISCSSNTS